MFGVLNINKPAGKTSRDVVNVVQQLAKPHKVGHAGTLDPLATGVLLTCVGPATRLICYAQQLKKTYIATFRLGERSESDDIEGAVESLDDAIVPDEAKILDTLPQFIGRIQQVPPAYSAIKLGGKRAYQLARRGENVELTPRPVVVYSIDLLSYTYPELKLQIVCGSGTYIRSLGRDLAQHLGTAAVMCGLCRTTIGAFDVSTAVAVGELNAESLVAHLHPPLALLDDLPRVSLNAEEVETISWGRFINDRFAANGEEFAAVDANEELVAVLKRRKSNQLGPKINFIGRN